ncbi:membrane peptidoglycan carboxypeptidase [Actinoalloteichus hoggarensis]|uniref:Penicillin-binding protein 1A n=1 Tax=Actinoalloteichus hoggarensis TaxID=1470176 RepID=A0A221WCB5_9PSEU|nr:transglycosylase domain-containing protein [Actinoalloteichus hoggarensis]ASO23129.1 Penicillin-binding protein 1A [Actinoalloteichus hoggarensis]MBB5922734.1 membrane peptidoglycan carboxypeptidase [Actinoalloteichus hoggarensis]
MPPQNGERRPRQGGPSPLGAAAAGAALGAAGGAAVAGMNAGAPPGPGTPPGGVPGVGSPGGPGPVNGSSELPPPAHTQALRQGTGPGPRRPGEQPTPMMQPSDEQPTTQIEPQLLTHHEPVRIDDDYDEDDYYDEDDAEESPEAVKKAKRKKIWRRVRRTCYVMTGLAILTPVVAFAIGYQMWDAPSPEQILANLDKTVTVTYADGSEMLRIVPNGEGEGDRRFLSYEDIPEDFYNGVTATEDPSFENNMGFSPVGIVRAAVTGTGGGSTITQQYVKLSTGNDDGTYARKFEEVVKAFKLTQEESKPYIFESYANLTSFGRNTYGLEAGAQTWFGKSAPELELNESLFLAGILNAPSHYDPDNNREGMEARFDYVVNKMVEREHLSQAEADAVEFPDYLPRGAGGNTGRSITDVHLQQQIENELAGRNISMDEVRRQGMVIRTSIDKAAQEHSEAVMAEHFAGQPDELRGAMVAVDPATGAVRAYNGGEWSSGIDFAASMQPPGSSFKPFVVAAGLQRDQGIGEFYDGRETIDIEGTVFSNTAQCPTGANEHCSVRNAMLVSANTPFIDMAHQFGPSSVAETAHAAGIPEQIGETKTLVNSEGFTAAGIALGQYEVRTIDMAVAYASFANGGIHHEPYFVEFVGHEGDGPDDVVLLDRANEGHEGEQAFGPRSKAVADNVTEVLKPVAAHTSHDLPGREVAAKTGTHQFGQSAGNQAGWMVGYTPQISVAVWVGSEVPAALTVNATATNPATEQLWGRNVPAFAWKAFMEGYLADKDAVGFPTDIERIGIFDEQPRPRPPEPPEGDRDRDRDRDEDDEGRDEDEDGRDEDDEEPGWSDSPDPGDGSTDPGDGGTDPSSPTPPDGNCPPWACEDNGGGGGGGGDGPPPWGFTPETGSGRDTSSRGGADPVPTRDVPLPD